MSAPNSTFWRFSRCPGSMMPAKKREARLSSRMGNSTMKAAPRKAPPRVPSPPMMMMNSAWNDRLRSKPCGSTVPR